MSPTFRADPTLRIAITPGEPAGIGPELAVRLAQQDQDLELVAISDPKLLTQYAKCLGLNLKVRLTTADSSASPTPAGEIACIPITMPAAVTPGQLQTANSQYVIKTLELASMLALTNRVQAIVTGPVQKSIINDAGIAFSGHTEFFADKSAVSKVVMMLATDSLRVALTTTHLPLKDVPAAITASNLTQILTILHSELIQKFAIPSPHILVCGLNPHAGEGGHLGTEEIDVISPVLDTLRAQGMNLSGPMPADTLFTPKYLANADAVLAMYHDQGLPVLKYQGFGNAVNITLGLPYIRTSVDHGTALDLAGKGLADIGSLNVALKQAAAMAKAQQMRAVKTP